MAFVHNQNSDVGLTENLAHKLQASLNYTLIFSLHRLLMAVGRWVYDNPHTQYTLRNAVAVVYMTDWRR